MDLNRDWWREVVIYQIYVQSFQDSNNDGIGDLRGIIQRLDYIKRLGADMLWLTPIYESPLEDQGYDISNYKAINPMYGTMTDWEDLIAEVHRRGMKLMMDMVFNHTSSQVRPQLKPIVACIRTSSLELTMAQHAWFLESKKDKDNPKRDWYFWRPGRIGNNGERLPPNNWASLFGGWASLSRSLCIWARALMFNTQDLHGNTMRPLMSGVCSLYWTDEARKHH